MSVTQLISPEHLLSAYGLIGIIAIIFAETGLLIGFFLPGDSLLFLAGAYAASNRSSAAVHFPLLPLLVGVSLAAIVGCQVGYAIGRVLGEKLLYNPRRRLIKQVHVDRTRQALEQYGEFKAVLLARVIPIVRTLIGPVVGALEMDARTFFLANVLGGLVWAIGVTLLGYALGAAINIDKYILPLTAAVILVSLVPIIREGRKHVRR